MLGACHTWPMVPALTPLTGCLHALLAAFLAVTAFAAPDKLPPLELPVPDSVLKESRRLAYGVYMKSDKIGWGLDTRAPGKLDGKDCIIAAMERDIQIKALGNSIQTESVDRHYFDAAFPNRALRIECHQKQDGRERKVLLKLKTESTYTVEITEAGKTEARKTQTSTSV